MNPALEASEIHVLLVEDDPLDAELAQRSVSGGATRFVFTHVARVSEAIERFESAPVDCVLLDLNLPDSQGVDSVRQIRERATTAPIVVLTGAEDPNLGELCIEAGADDFISKDDGRPTVLLRSVLRVINRFRNEQSRQAEQTRREYSAMSFSGTSTEVTRQLSGSLSVRERLTASAWHQLTRDYMAVVEAYLRHLVVVREKPTMQMEGLVTRLGDLGAGPRDLVEIHLSALDELIKKVAPDLGNSMTTESRLLALEMMGHLVEYYRVGVRRRGR